MGRTRTVEEPDVMPGSDECKAELGTLSRGSMVQTKRGRAAPRRAEDGARMCRIRPQRMAQRAHRAHAGPEVSGLMWPRGLALTRASSPPGRSRLRSVAMSPLPAALIAGLLRLPGRSQADARHGAALSPPEPVSVVTVCYRTCWWSAGVMYMVPLLALGQSAPETSAPAHRPGSRPAHCPGRSRRRRAVLAGSSQPATSIVRKE
jgi:hypothetical protein